MKIYKTWNSVIASYLPSFKNQSFIVFVPEDYNEKQFLFNFFNIFLTDFVKYLDGIYYELKQIGQEKAFNQNLLPLLKTTKFYLMTTQEEYIVPRDTFIELIKLVKETFVLSLKKSNLNFPIDTNAPNKAFNFAKDNIVLLGYNNTDNNKDNELELDIKKFEYEMIKFIDSQILSKFDKRKNNTNKQ